jgi:uncharacterized DUF497 family protein
LEFEWHGAKAAANLQTHGVSFEREERIRIISARGVTQHEQDDYFRQNA